MTSVDTLKPDVNSEAMAVDDPATPRSGKENAEDVEMKEIAEKTDVPEKSDAIDSDDAASLGGGERSEDEDLTQDPLEKIQRAEKHKEAGNEWFKQQENRKAQKEYESGLRAIKKVQLPNQTSVELLQTALRLNLAAALNRRGKYTLAITKVNEVLKVDSQNVKALLRRGFALLETGNAKESREDFQAVLRLEPANAQARTELVRANTLYSEQKKKEKEQFGSLFARGGGGGLYMDKEREAARRAEKEEEEREKKRRKWQAENTKRKEAGEDEVTFEDWTKAQEEKEKEEKEKKEKEKKEKEKKDFPPPPAAPLSPSSTDAAPKADAPSSSSRGKTDISEAEIDEEDAKIIEETKKMGGYCYFKRDLTDEEKQRREQHHVPQRIDTSDAGTGAAAASPTPIPQPEKGVSSWNTNGTTWEERDVTKKSSDSFKEILTTIEANTVSADGGVSVKGRITSVKSWSGDAHVAVVRGRKRLIYDFHTVLSVAFDVQLQETSGDTEPTSMKGELTIPELTSTRDSAETSWLKHSPARILDTNIPPSIHQSISANFESLRSLVQEAQLQFETSFVDVA